MKSDHLTLNGPGEEADTAITVKSVLANAIKARRMCHA